MIGFAERLEGIFPDLRETADFQLRQLYRFVIYLVWPELRVG